MRYEDLINKPDKTFKNISNYISKILNIKITDEKIRDSVKKSSFDNLKKAEERFGFSEAPIDAKTQKQKKFFNLGKQNNWKKLLPDEIKKKIEKEFNKEMVELGYLNS